MHLVLDDYGLQLDKTDQMFCIRLGAQERSISPVKVTAIHIYKNMQVSSAALLLAVQHDIPVILYDGTYKPAARIWNSNFTSTGQVRVMQPLFCESSSGVWWCKRIATLKLEGQLHNLAYYINRFQAASAALRLARETIQKNIIQVEALPVEQQVLDTLRGYEGSATAAYWAAYDTLLEDAVFTRRIQRNPREPFNACVNYLYGILYGKVEGALLSYGLDPMVGLMHVEGYNKRSLVYDCIEPFRQWAEQLLVTLFQGDVLVSTLFLYDEDRLSLSKECRKLLVSRFHLFLQQKTLMNKRRVTRNDQITAFCSGLSQAVKNFQPEKMIP